MVEQFGYPKGPEGGIDFGQVTSLDGSDIIIRGASGEALQCTFDPDSIYIRDLRGKISDFSMEAFVVQDGEPNPFEAVQFGIFTRSDDKNARQKNVHPDLFARKFVEFSLQYFESMGHNIRMFACQWGWGTNYEQFMKEFLATGNKVVAAKSTWSGRVAMEHGFIKLGLEDVVLDSQRDETIVYAYFQKPREGTL